MGLADDLNPRRMAFGEIARCSLDNLAGFRHDASNTDLLRAMVLQLESHTHGAWGLLMMCRCVDVLHWRPSCGVVGKCIAMYGGGALKRARGRGWRKSLRVAPLLFGVPKLSVNRQISLRGRS